jgi:hypothetical protein
MQLMASQSISSPASSDIVFQFQDLLNQAQLATIGTSINGVDLLNGNSGMMVTVGLAGTVNSQYTINAANISGSVTYGLLNGLLVNTPDNANLALSSIQSSLMIISNAEMSLNIDSENLRNYEKKLTDSANDVQTQINSIETIDTAQMQDQLQQLNQKVLVYSLLSKLNK